VAVGEESGVVATSLLDPVGELDGVGIAVFGVAVGNFPAFE
jgi:hypothetical protein